jgi:hypothetical protein
MWKLTWGSPGASLRGWTGVSPSGLGKDRSFRGCALRYLGSRLYISDAGVAELAKPAESGSEAEQECEDDLRGIRDL